MDSTHNPSQSLAELASLIRSEHTSVLKCTRQSLLHDRQAGDWLVQAKQLLIEKRGHGHWERWIEDDLHISKRTAQAYMQIATGWDELRKIVENKAQDLAYFGISHALRALATPRSPQPNTVLPNDGPSWQPTEPDDTIPEPHYDVSEIQPGVLRIAANVEWTDEEYSVESIQPAVQPNIMSVEDAQEFTRTWSLIARRSALLAEQASRFPSHHSGAEELIAHLQSVRLAASTTEEAIHNE